MSVSCRKRGRMPESLCGPGTWIARKWSSNLRFMYVCSTVVLLDDFRAIHVPGPHSDSGIRPRFRKLTDIHPDLEIVRPEGPPIGA